MPCIRLVQWNRMLGYEPRGREFKSLSGCHTTKSLLAFVVVISQHTVMRGWNKMRQAFFGVGINRVTCPISIMVIRLIYIQELLVRFYHWVPRTFEGEDEL